MPGTVQAAIEDRLGSKVVAAHSQTGGFSPGVAARLELTDGSRAFVKAVCTVPNPDSPAMHRREARIAAALPASVPAPALRFSYDDGEWIALAFDDVDGHNPTMPWNAAELERVLSALHDLAVALTPAPIALDTARDGLARQLGGWRRIAADEKLRARVPGGVRRRLPELLDLEEHWPEAVGGDSLVHLDLRADNILLTSARVFVVDWPAAAIGAPWLDLVAMLPSVAMQGGPEPEGVWRAHPLGRGVDDRRVDAFVAALAGYFVHSALLPAPAGLPTLRVFQAGQGTTAFDWLARRRQWVT